MDDQYIWTGTGDGQSWNDRKNWYDKTKAQLPAAVPPGLTSNVTIANADITDTGSADILNVTGPLTLEGNLTANQFTDTGGTTVDAGATLGVNSTSLGASEAANLTLVGATVALTKLTVAATGTLTLTSASTFTARGGTNPTPANGTLGLDLEGTGTIDASTFDSHAATLEVGQHNNASLTISDGSTVKSALTLLGNATDGSGNLLVTDAGTTWTDGGLQVGGAGAGALTLAAGATLNETGTLVLGAGANASGNMTITDAGTTATVASSLIVGQGGSGGLAVQSGAALTVGTQLGATGQAVELGALAGSNGSLDVNGATLSAATGAFDIGYDGSGAVSIEAGAQVTTGDASGATARGIDIGVAADGSGAMSVDGSGTTLTNTGRFVVGDSGNGAFTASNGAVVSTTIGAAFGLDGLSVGHAATGVGAVDVNGATLTIATDLVVGDAGQGGLTVENGATLNLATGGNIVSGSALALGVQSTGNGAMTVTGPGSVLNAAKGQLALGVASQAAMSIANGATAVTGDASGTTANGLDMGLAATGGGALSVDGAGTTLINTGRFVVGDAGNGALTVSGGAVVATSVAADLGIDGAVLGAADGGVGNVDVTGIGSNLQIATDLVAGAAGASGVTVEAGATLDIGAALAAPGAVLVLGQAASGQGTLDVHGKGTVLLANRGTFVVGQAGQGTASFSLGGQAAIGDASGGSSNGLEMAEDVQSTAALSVDGTNTKLTTSGALTIGDAGAATLAVTNGATMASSGADPFGSAVLGAQATGSAAADINGGTWRVGQNLTVGEDGSATLTIEQGGTVAVGGPTLTLGAAADGTGTLAMSSPATTLDFGGTLVVGDAGTGTFNLSQGATFAGAAGVVLGRQAGALGSVTVQGAGSGLTTNALTLGGAGEGDLQVFDDDTVAVQGDLEAGLSVGGTGTANVTGAGSALSVSGTGVIGDAGTYAVTVAGGAAASFGGALTLGQQATGTGTLTVGQGSQVTAATLAVGGAGTGDLEVETGAALKISGASIDIGVQAGGVGTLMIDSATLAFAGALTVGDGGDGTFTLTGGAQYKTTGGLVVGNRAGSSGHIALDAAAALTVAGDMTLGLQGEGDLAQTSGANLAVAGNLVEASGAAATGTSTLGATTIGGNWTIGLGGAHRDTITGSTVAVGGALTIGAAAGANGALTIEGSGSKLSVGGAITVGSGGAGALTIEAGAVFDARLDAVTLGALSGGSGTLTLTSGGGLKAASFTMGAGLTSVSAGSALQIGGAAVVGAIPGGIAELDDSGVLNAASLTVGALGTGTVRIASVGNTITGGVSIGDGSGAVGTLDVTGGLTLGGLLTVGNAGTGTLDVHGNRLLQVGATSVGVAAGSVGEIDVSGSGTVLQTTGLTLGGLGAATLDVTGNGQLAVSGSAAFAAQQGGAAVSATLDGLGSLTVAQNLTLGSSGAASLRIQNGGQASVSGTLTLGATALSSGTMTVTGSNTDPTGTITTFSQLNVGTLIVGQAGAGTLAVSQSAIVKSAGPIEVAAGNGETSSLTLDGAGSSLQGGALYVGGSNLAAGGSGTLAIGTGATANLATAHVWSSGTVTLAGGSLQSAALAIDAGGGLSGYGTVSAPISNNGALLAAGGVLDLAGGVSGAGTLKIASNATLQLGGPVAGNTVQFTGTGETLRIDDLARAVSTAGITTQQQDFNALVSGLAVGDRIAIYRPGLGVLQTIDGYHLVAGTTPGTTSLVLTQGTTTVASLTLAGDYTGASFKLSADTSNAALIDLTETACYAQGTHIRTPSGDVAVETLRPGDLVVTADGLARPILWLGVRTIDCTRHPKPHLACPIVVSKDAFGAGLPVRDLALSWGHSLCIDDVLVPVENLINGATIRQVPAERITYWHVELNSHDLLYAEGLVSETYLDAGNRMVFSNGGAFCQLHPDFSRPANAPTCRPLHVEGAVVTKARRQLQARAEALGFKRLVDADAGLHLLADGVIIEPQSMRDDRVAFVVPVATRDLRLVSSTFVPAHVEPGVTDMRRLGVCLRRLLIGDEAGLRQTRIALDHPALDIGLYGIETDGEKTWRWTSGSAQLDAALWAGYDGTDFHLRLIVDGGASRGRWLPPDRAGDASAEAIRACA